MTPREANLIWLKDMLENLSSCREQLEDAEDHETARVVSETMLSDLERCRRLCETLYRRSLTYHTV
jgi:hypothetical protein